MYQNVKSPRSPWSITFLSLWQEGRGSGDRGTDSLTFALEWGTVSPSHTIFLFLPLTPLDVPSCLAHYSSNGARTSAIGGRGTHWKAGAEFSGLICPISPPTFLITCTSHDGVLCKVSFQLFDSLIPIFASARVQRGPNISPEWMKIWSMLPVVPSCAEIYSSYLWQSQDYPAISTNSPETWFDFRKYRNQYHRKRATF